MKKITIQSTIEVYDSIVDLNEADQALLQKAHQQVDYAYAPYSNFLVGAAVRLKNGALIGGCNQENASYPMCICAEPATLAAAASAYPNTPILAMAITAKHHKRPVLKPAAPCGACRQMLSEAEDRYQQKISLILQGEQGQIYKIDSAKTILPLFFSGGYLTP